MTLALRYSVYCEVGLVRKNNQDSGYVSPNLMMVADGMGGAAAGDLASAVAVVELSKTEPEIRRLLDTANDSTLPAPGPADTLEPETLEAPTSVEPESILPDDPILLALEDAIERASDRIADLVAEDPGLDGMGTTVCGFAFDAPRNLLHVVNIGDSRAYRYRDGELTRLTKDHSWIQTLIDEGRISEADALQHPHRSLILRVINGSPHHVPDLSVTDVRVGDRLMVCSDGLCGLVTDAELAPAMAIADREETVRRLVALAHAAGGSDNITIALSDVVDGEPEGTPQIVGAAATVTIPPLEDQALLDTEPPTVPPTPADAETTRYALRQRRGSTWVKALAFVVVPLLVLAGGAAAWWRYVQGQYYVAPSDGMVAIYQGIPDRIGSFNLSHLASTSDTAVADLQPVWQERVRATIRVTDLATAQNTIAELKQKSALCIAQRSARAKATETPTPTPTPTPTDPASPSTSPILTPSVEVTPSSSLSPVASPTPSVSTAPAPEEC